MFSHLYPESFHLFPAHIFPIKRYKDILFKLTNSVTNKIIVVRTVYFYHSGSIFATKNYVTESVLYEVILALLDREKMRAGKWCITFWVKMKKHGETSTYF